MNSGELSASELNSAALEFEKLSGKLDDKEMRWLELSERAN